jgi:hypothetical protein
MNFLKTIDMSGSEFKLTIDSKKKLNSTLGGLFTLILVISMLILFYLLGQNFYLRINPTLATSVQVDQDYFNYTLNSSSMMFAFHLEDQNALKIDRPDFFYFEPHYYVYQLTDNGFVLEKDEILKYRPCLREDVSNNSVYDVQKLEHFNCFEWPENGLTTGGLWQHQRVQFINIQTRNCHTAPQDYLDQHNITCSKNLTELSEIFNAYAYFAVIIQSSLIDVEDYENPLKLSFNYMYDLLGMNLMKKAFYYMQMGLIRDNKGWITETRNETELIGLGRTKYDFTISTEDDFSKTYFHCLLFYDSVIQKFDRRFSKVQELLGSLGGLLKTFSFIIGVFIKVYNEHYMNMFIIKNCYQIYDNIKRDSSANEKSKSGIYLYKNNIKHNLSINNLSNVKINPKSEIDNVNANQSNLKRVDFKFHFYEMMLSIMFIYSKKRKTYDFYKLARSSLFRQSDIICIINRLNQLDQHLNANLNQKQLNELLNYRKALVLS